MNIKIHSKLLELICMYQKFLFWMGVAHVSPDYAHVYDHSLLLWLTLDRAPLPLLIKPKVVKEALQWRSEWQVQVQSYFNQTELTSELWNWTCNAITSLTLNGTVVPRTTDLEKTVNMNWLPFSLSVTTIIDAFLYDGNVWMHVNCSLWDANTRKSHTSQESNLWIRSKFPKIPIL